MKSKGKSQQKKEAKIQDLQIEIDEFKVKPCLAKADVKDAYDEPFVTTLVFYGFVNINTI